MYGVDLCGLWTGELTLRRVDVLVRGMPPGGALGVALGGGAAWSPEVGAALQSAWWIVNTVAQIAGGKAVPKPAPPPKWEDVADGAPTPEERDARKAAKWLARYGDRT